MLADTTITESERDYWLTIQDLRFPEPNFTADFPYQGAYWDSTRSILGQLEENYSSSPLLSRVVALNEELQIPSEVERPILSDVEQIAQNLPIEAAEEAAQIEVIQTPPTLQTNEREEEEITSAESPVITEEEEIISTEPPVTTEEEEVASTESADTTESEFMASYTIVLHSFRNVQTARTTADELIQFGDTVFICPRVIDNSTYYRVSIGSFEEMVNAMQKSRILEEPFRTNNFISSTSSACEIIYLSE
jgi:cell division septation protein DedD